MFKKIKIISISLFLILFLIISSYLAYDYIIYNKEIKNNLEEFSKIVEYESIDNYEIIEEDGKKKVINRNAGLSFIIPEEWDVKKIKSDDIIEISSPNSIREPDEYGGFIKEGCILWIGVDYYKNGSENRPFLIKEKIDLGNNYFKDNEKLISVDGLDGLETETGNLIFIEFPDNNRIYKFFLYSVEKEKNKCSIELNEFFKTVSISKN